MCHCVRDSELYFRHFHGNILQYRYIGLKPSEHGLWYTMTLQVIRGRCEGRCDITVESRSFCKKCRLAKCFTVGMRKDMILSKLSI